jgi:hypothetical protein
MAFLTARDCNSRPNIDSILKSWIFKAWVNSRELLKTYTELKHEEEYEKLSNNERETFNTLRDDMQQSHSTISAISIKNEWQV